MKVTQRSLLFLFLLVAVFVSMRCKDDNSFDITFLTEEYAPFNYTENGDLKGITVDIVNHIMDDLDMEGSIIVLPWNEAYDRLLHKPDVALFTTALTPERRNYFKWVGPVGTMRSHFYVLTSSGITIKNMEEARQVESIGLVEGYALQEVLETQGFQNLVMYTDVDELVDRLLDGTVDMILELAYSVRLSLEKKGHSFSNVRDVYPVVDLLSYIAFNIDVPDDVVGEWQDKIDQMKDNGTLQQIYSRYVPGEKAPGKLQIYTEHDPPQNYNCDNEALCGSAVEVVSEIKARIGCPDPIMLTQWDNAYNIALINPNTVLFSTVRTDEREYLFEWVGPVCRNNYAFYVKSNSGIHINNIEDAKSLATIGVVDGWFVEDLLLDEGFTNLVIFFDPDEILNALMEGTLEASVFSDISISYITQNAGYSANDVTLQVIISTVYQYIAFGKGTKQEYFNDWTDALVQMKEDGAFAGIWDKWYHGVPLP